MTDIGELKRKACAAIDARKPEIVRVAKHILENPETGFNERRTGAVVTHEFQKMGIPYRGKLARTGIKGRIEGGAGPGPTVGILGELDSLLAFEHPFADPDTGAAHACGHHAQIGMMLGAAMGLLSPDVLGELSGAIVPFAVPAEEFVEVERRLALRENGDIEFLGGKQELIRLGEFDDIDMAMMCHTASDMGARRFSIGGTSNGHMVKFVEYTGRGAHAGSAPHLGINALNAANIAMAAIHANRETFREQETARVHGMVNRGGDVVNAVPADVRLEWRVRSSTPEALVRNNARVDRCFKAGALAVGAKVRITTIPGYFPLRHDPTLRDLFRSNAQEVVGRDRVLVISTSRNRGGSTDMGDLSQIMPICHPWTAGAAGPGHSKDYLIRDYDQAVINPAKIMAMVVIDLLAEDALGARKVLSESRPSMTKDQYISFQRQRAAVVDFDGGVE
ncbi:MAG: amidohydrolase [Dehalococcoidia bacterium]|nr:amidohydrolase [Dehalococcoidia bacterium]